MGNKPSSGAQAIKAPKDSLNKSVRFSESSHGGGIDSASSRNNASPLSRNSSSAPSLREGMMRHRKDTDPFKHYEVIHVLGVGSMGSVSKVKKRASAVGGSARSHNVSSRSSFEDSLRGLHCIGDIFRSCTESSKDIIPTDVESAHSAVSAVSDGSNPQGGYRLRCSPKENLLANVTSADADMGAAVPRHVRGSSYEMFFALKSIHLSRVNDATFIRELKNEIEILQTLDHPFIVRPIETYEHRKHLYMVMELCSGGDLYSRDPYTEEQAARIVGSILSAVSFMHSRNVSHRDLKFENVMFANKRPRSEIKIIDFGLSKKYLADEKYLKDSVGTIYTMSPEVLKGQYTTKADIWSIGVIAYMLLSSHMPFYGQKRRIVVEKIMKCRYEFRGRRWKDVSQQSMKFVGNLLQYDPDVRPSAEEALQEPWLNMSSAATIHWPNGHNGTSGEDFVMDSVYSSLKAFSDYSKLKKLALMVVAHKSTSDEIGLLRKAFQKYDKDKTGTIEKDEFKACLEDYGYPDKDVERLFEGCDIDGTGVIRYTEFLAATIEALGAINEERLAEAFDRLDCDDSGYISTKNLQEVLGEELSKDDIRGIIDEADQTKDGKISYDEFLSLWDKEQENRRTDALSELCQAHELVHV